MKIRYFDIENRVASDDISLIFPGWVDSDERVAIFSPHDDDALIGTGYAITGLLQNGAQVFILIFCNGNAGYSVPGQKDTIVDTRAKETIKSYELLGIPAENIIRFDYDDFSVLPYIGSCLPDGREGTFKKILRTFRKLAITRALIPNGFREHIDHEAVFRIASYDVVQAGDPIFADLGSMKPVRSILQYSVWADFDRENSLFSKNRLRAGKVILADKKVEEKIHTSLYAFKSQQEIIKDLVKQREDRKYGDGYVEVYTDYDARPKLAYQPYIDAVRSIDDENGRRHMP